jgi:hypothetical protein
MQLAGMPYTEIDIEKTPGAEDAMRALNGNSGKVPTILIESGDRRVILIEPSNRELSDTLRAFACL